MTTRRELLVALKEEHEAIESGLVSPYVTSMESYYLEALRIRRLKWPSVKRKITRASWIPKATRRHMINHLAALTGRLKRRTKTRLAGLALSLRRTDYGTVSVPKAGVEWVRDSKGRIYLHDSKTHRFVRQTEKERAYRERFVRRHKQEAKKQDG